MTAERRPWERGRPARNGPEARNPPERRHPDYPRHSRASGNPFRFIESRMKRRSDPLDTASDTRRPAYEAPNAVAAAVWRACIEELEAPNPET